MANREIEDDGGLDGIVLNGAGGGVDEECAAVGEGAVRLVDVAEDVDAGLDTLVDLSQQVKTSCSVATSAKIS